MSDLVSELLDGCYCEACAFDRCSCRIMKRAADRIQELEALNKDLKLELECAWYDMKEDR